MPPLFPADLGAENLATRWWPWRRWPAARSATCRPPPPPSARTCCRASPRCWTSRKIPRHRRHRAPPTPPSARSTPATPATVKLGQCGQGHHRRHTTGLEAAARRLPPPSSRWLRRRRGLSKLVGRELTKLGARPNLGAAKIISSGGRGMGSGETTTRCSSPWPTRSAQPCASWAACSMPATSPTTTRRLARPARSSRAAAGHCGGISGAIQHLAGMKDSKVIVAINRDPDKSADLPGSRLRPRGRPLQRPAPATRGCRLTGDTANVTVAYG